jgi:hypothetical protein
VSVQRAPRRPVIVPDGRDPEAARERFAKPRAGTALAPQTGSHPECALRMSEILWVVTEMVTVVNNSVAILVPPGVLPARGQ